jgi:GlpG protein
MRLLEETKNPDLAKGLSELLKDREIAHKLETVVNTNWGDDHYGESVYKIWVEDEDQFPQAETLFALYKENPHSDAVKIKPTRKKISEEPPLSLEPDAPQIPSGPLPLTRFVTLACVILFLFQLLTGPADPPRIASPLYVPSPVERTLLFDFPEAASLYTKAITLYYEPGMETLPKEGRVLITKALHTPYWKGFYDILAGTNTEWKSEPWFEKISSGEYWRLITPALLHGSLLHILFNLLWFWMLGKEVEKTIGSLRMGWLILIIAIGSNTLQYLMTGFQFLGLSGVVAGLLLFIGERQRLAPWEGYTLQRSVYYFLLFYIFGLAAIEILLFAASFIGLPNLPISIANTAHVGGALIGFLLGRLKIFAWKG